MGAISTSRNRPNLLSVSTADELLTSPSRGNSSFEGFMIQQILALEELRRPGSGSYFFRTHAGARSI
jgi:hypothetical protein